MVKRVKWLAYIACMLAACAVLLAIALPKLLPRKMDTYASHHPATTLAPLMGFAEDSIFNAGTAEAIDAFPGIGVVYSQRIVEGRSIFGDYQLPEDLLLVKGIGEKRLAAMMEALDEELIEIPLLMQRFAR